MTCPVHVGNLPVMHSDIFMRSLRSLNIHCTRADLRAILLLIEDCSCKNCTDAMLQVRMAGHNGSQI